MNVLKQPVRKVTYGSPNQLGMLVTFWNALSISNSNDTSKISIGEMVAIMSLLKYIYFSCMMHIATHAIRKF